MSKNFDHISDEQLMTLYYKELDQKWLGILLERYTLMLFGVCMKYLKQKTLAEDAVQQVFLKTLHKASTSNIQNIGAWLYQVAKNECFSRLRTQNHFENTEDLNLTPTEDSRSIRDWMAAENRFNQLETALKGLKPMQQNCITLFYLKEKSYKEVAEQLQISIKEVKSHIQNGKRNLKNSLSPAAEHLKKEGNL